MTAAANAVTAAEARTLVRIAWAFPWPTPPPKELRRKGGRYSISLNHMYIWTGRGGQRRLSAFAEGWKNDCIARIKCGGPVRLPAGDLALYLAIYPPNAVRRDTDGLIKLVQDAIFEATGIDDYRVVDLHAHRYPPDRQQPRIQAALMPWVEPALRVNAVVIV